jgi:hypothetical protein
MKTTIIILTLIYSISAAAQLTPHKQDILIPSIAFAYATDMEQFISLNNGLEVKRKIIIPELYIGVQLVTGVWSVKMNYGLLQKSVMIETGYAIRLKRRYK